MMLWAILLIVLIVSFPSYNLLIGNAPLDSKELSLFDIFQTTAIVLLIYLVNDMRQKSEQNERRLRELHQELSIRLSNDKKDK